MKLTHFHAVSLHQKAILATAIAAMISGCTLEDVHIKCGQNNEEFLGYIFDDLKHPVNSIDALSERNLSNEQKDSYIASFTNKYCPETWYCIDMHDAGGSKIGEACNPCRSDREILCTNECRDIYTSQDHCGACNNKCPDYAVCIDGVCEEIVECEPGQHPYQGKCEDDSVENCGTHGNDCTESTGWADGECREGKCYATECLDEYKNDNGKCAALMNCPENKHIHINTCEDDSLENCGAHGRNCLELDGVVNAVCSHGKCVADACREGFCLSGTVCAEGYYNPKTCGITGDACTVCEADQACSKGECILDFCGKHQHLYEGECEADSLDNCGAHGLSCVFSNAKSQICDDGTCKVQECEAGYHLYENSCEMDDPENCGAHDNACAKQIDGWKSGTCENQKCKLNSCTSGHVYDNACEADDMDNCGKHGNACQSDHAISECSKSQCRLIKCEPGYFEISGKCNEAKTETGIVVDPWGLIWNSTSRTATHSDASTKCKEEGGRLPTPTEIWRNNATSGFQGVIGTTADTAEIWSDTTYTEANYAESIALATGNMKKYKISSAYSYRCVWDAKERPKTFTGVNCHGKPGENGCQEITIGTTKFTVDSLERPAQFWFQAAEECHKLGARLPLISEYPALIVAGIAGSGNNNWTVLTGRENAAVFKWTGIVSSIADIKPSYKTSITSKNAFRCISEAVKTNEADLPIFMQPRVVNKDGVMQVGPQLWIDKAPRPKATIYDAEYACMQDGGRLPSLDEMTFAIKNGLPKPESDTKGSIAYLTSSVATCHENSTKMCNSTIKFGSTVAPYYYYGSLGNENATTEVPYYCTYRPARSFDFTELDNQVKEGILYKYSISGVDHYIDNKDYTNTADSYRNAARSAMLKDMRLPSDGEITCMIESGLRNGSENYLMTSKIGHYGEDTTLGFRSCKGTSNPEVYEPAKNMKYFKLENKTPLIRKYAASTIY